MQADAPQPEGAPFLARPTSSARQRPPGTQSAAPVRALARAAARALPRAGVPRVRLRYVQGLAAAHEELRLPCVVDLTTDGQQLIVATPGAGRPLLRLPLAAAQRPRLTPACGPATAPNRAAARLVGDEHVIVLQFGAAAGVPAAVAGEPLIFADPHDEEVAPRLHALADVLTPWTGAEIAQLRRAERRLARLYAIVFVALVILALFIGLAIQQLIAGPKPSDRDL